MKKIALIPVILLLFCQCTTEQDVVDQLETMQRFRNNFRLSIKALQDSMQSHINYIRLCNGTMVERKPVIKAFQLEHQLYLDSLMNQTKTIYQKSDSVRMVVMEVVKHWEILESKVEIWISKYRQSSLSAGVLLDSLRQAENTMIESTKQADELRDWVVDLSARSKSACQVYDQNWRNAKQIYAPRLAEEYRKMWN